MALQFRRGLDSDRGTITPTMGEPIFTTDTKELYVGDGTTAGGIDVVQSKLGQVSGHIVPEADSTYDLGDSSRKFRDLYLSGNSIFLGDNLILRNQGGTFTAQDSSNNTINISLAANTTTDLAEGTNKYYTTARTDSDAKRALLGVDAGGDGSFTYDSASGVMTYTGPSAAEVRAHFSAGEGIDLSSGAISAEDATETNKGIASFSNDHFTVSSGAVAIKADGIDDTHLDFGTGTNQINTGDIPELTNLFYTDTRFDTRLSAKTTDNLTEGSSNLYFTNARADARIANALLDEDNMASNSATKVPSQQSVKAYVDAEVAGIVDTAPAALNTLNELAAALGDDANFSTTVTASIAAKLDSAEAIALIDSAYVAARSSAGTDSATVIALIDSDYIQARALTPIPNFNKISISGQGDVVADAASALPNWPSGTQQAKITASDGASSDGFGHGVAISTDGNYAIIGSYNDDDTASNSGSAYIYIRSGTSWTQQAKINASDAASNDFFGNSVAINADGTIVAVGARKEDSNKGAVYLFTRTGASWSQSQKIVSTSAHAANAYFGKSVGLSDTGNRLVIGTEGGGNPSSSGYMEVLEGSPDTNLQNASYDNVYIDVRGSSYTNGVSGAALSRAYSLEFNGDGTKLFVMNNDNYIYQFNLSTAFDISTASYPSPAVRFYVGPGGNATSTSTGISMQFKPDGTKLFIVDGHYGKLNEYALSTAYDITTMSFTAQFDLTNNGYNGQQIRGMGVTYDGSKFFIGTANQNRLYAYSMSTPWDVSTSSYSNQSFRLSDIGGSNSHAFASVRFNQAGTKMFFLHYAGQLRQIDLSVPNNLFSGTRSLTYAEDVTGQGTQSYDFAFNNDMSKFYVANAASNATVHQYSTGASSTAYGGNQVLVASDAAANDYTGRDVTISGDGLYIATGSIEDDGGAGSGSGSAYIWYYGGSSYSQQAKITPSDAAGNDKFGTSVSIDQDGNTLIVGARAADEPNNDQGAAYVFTRSGTSWSQQAKLVSSATQNSAEFGASVSISDDGNIAVGIARRETNSGAGVGSAYVFSRTGSTWALSKKIFGSDAVGGYLGFEPHAMDIAGDGLTMIAGNHSASSTTGAAYVFTAPEGVTLSDTLTLEAGTNITLTTTPGTDTISIAAGASTDSATTQAMIDSSIGFQVDSAYVAARSSAGTDSSTVTALIDSSLTTINTTLSSSDSGQAIDTFSKSSFRTVKYTAQLSTPLVPASFTWDSAVDTAAIQHTGASNGDYFGRSVDIDRNYAIIGADEADADGGTSGEAYIFYKSGGTWSQQVLLSGQSSGAGQAGEAVAIGGSTEGLRAAVGIPRYPGGNKQGRVAFYTRSGTTWTHQANVAGPGGNNSVFGSALQMSGDTTVVGAHEDDTTATNAGRVYVYTGNGTLQQAIASSDIAGDDYFGWDVDIDGDLMVASSPYKNVQQGAAYIFERSGTTWTQKAKITHSSPSNSDRFGWSVACHAGANGTNTIAVGLNDASSGGSPAGGGKVYVFTGSGTSYTQQALIQSSDVAASDKFGGYHHDNVAFNKGQDQGDTLFISAAQDDDGGTNTGSLYVFTRSGSTWSQQYKKNAFTIGPSANAYFGNSISADAHGSLIVGAFGDDEGGTGRGAAYIFDARTIAASQQPKVHSQELLLTHNDSAVAMTGFAKLLMDSDLGTFDATVDSANVSLKLSPTYTNTTVKLKAIRTKA